MKKSIYSLLFFLVLFLTVRAQDNPTEQQLKVQQVVKNMFQALAERKAEEVKQYCTADISILESGAVWNMDTLVQKINQNTAKDFKRINTFEFLSTEIKGNTAWTTFNNRADISNNGKEMIVKWLETAILIKEGKAWKIKLLHSTLKERTKK